MNSTTPPPTGSVDTANILMPDGTHSNGVTIGAATGVNGVGQSHSNDYLTLRLGRGNTHIFYNFAGRRTGRSV